VYLASAWRSQATRKALLPGQPYSRQGSSRAAACSLESDALLTGPAVRSILESEDASRWIRRIDSRLLRIDLEGMRKVLQSVIVSFALLIVPAVSQAASKVSFQAGSEQQVLVLLNQIRAQHNLSPFSASAPLRTAARAHSGDMLQKSYFDHNSPSESWDARVARYLKSPLTGENIAWGQGSYGSAAGIVSQWMNSPTHRAIILTAGLHRVGLGLALGTYKGSSGAVMATADFAA
jgi:uncharacterized protein YkwD